MPWYGWVGLVVAVIVLLPFTAGRITLMVGVLLLMGAALTADHVTKPLAGICGEVDNPFTGVPNNVPYRMLSSMKDGHVVYALIRPIDSPNSSVRCVRWKEELPSKFFVNDEGAIVSLASP